MGPGEYLLDKLEAQGLSRKEAWERAGLAVEAAEPPFADPVKEAPDRPPQGKHYRVSNALYDLAGKASRVEADFEYQYGYNQDLVRQTADLSREKGELTLALNQANLENADLAESRADYALQVDRLNGRLSLALRPARWLRRFAVAGWLLAALAGGVVAAEKSTGQPIDMLAKDAILYLSEVTK